MKIFLLSLVISTTFLVDTFTQNCLPNGLVIVRQGQIDSFSIRYPGCIKVEGDLEIDGLGENIDSLVGLLQLREVGGDLIIRGTTIESLKGLDSLVSVNRSLNIRQNQNLKDLAGLESLETTGFSLVIYDNQILQTLSGIENLSTIGYNLYVGYNPGLLTIENLTNLSSVQQSIVISNNNRLKSIEVLGSIKDLRENCHIISNDSLQNLRGLHGLKTIGNLNLSGNKSLKDYSGLDSLETIHGDVEFNGCLTKNIKGFPSITEIGRDLIIHNNDSLENFEGLEYLSKISRSLSISNNLHLTDFSHLNSVTIIGGLNVNNNPSLTTVFGLENVITIDGGLKITYNPKLFDLSPLINAISINGKVEISFNEFLTSLHGLDNLLDGNITYLEILGNDKLSNCAVESICEYLYGGAAYYVAANDPGCNTREEVIDICLTTATNAIDQNEYSFYPNPTTGILFTGGMDDILTDIKLSDINGQIIRLSHYGPDQIDISHLPDGIYFLSIITSTSANSIKIVKTQ